jgi:hypothetical protein
MRIATSISTTASTSTSFAEAFSDLCARLDAEPHHIFLSYTELHDPEELARAAAELPASIRLHGSSSCLSFMTEAGIPNPGGHALGMLGIADAEGSFGVASEPIGETPRAAGARAALRAVADADRAGEVPALVWLTSALGSEEEILLGIADVLGPNVPVFGGSSAANSVVGGWSQVERGRAQRDAAVLSALFPSGEISFAFGAGYAPTAMKGVVTRAKGRIVYELDGLPAAEVYNQWTDGLITPQLDGGSILEHTSFHPVGRVAGQIGKVPQYLLIHPFSVEANRAVTFGVNIAEGDELLLMAGSRESLIGRMQNVAAAARQAAGPSFQLTGALVIFCGGCMLAVREDMHRVVEGLRATLGGAPFLGMFTFGEQGCFTRGKNHHGNLSLSSVLFGHEGP